MITRKGIKDKMNIIFTQIRNEDKLIYSFGNKKLSIDMYLIHHVSIKYNIFRFKIIELAKKFNCTKRTVRDALKLIKDNKYLIVTNHYIRYRGYHPKHINKGDDSNE